MKLPVSDIKLNTDNPRLIKDEKYDKLVQSLKEFPEMANVREVVVNKNYVILGGNMRYRAMVEAGWEEIPVKVVDWSEDKQKEFIIKDNASFGEWDWDIELDPKYCDVIRKRYAKFIGEDERWVEETPIINAGEKQVKQDAIPK